MSNRFKFGKRGGRGGNWKGKRSKVFRDNQPTDQWLNREKRDALQRKERRKTTEEHDRSFGIDPYRGGEMGVRTGWLLHIVQCFVHDSDSGIERSGVDLYFIEEDGNVFKASFLREPYFYIKTRAKLTETEAALRQRFPGIISTVTEMDMVDLDQANHLSGIKNRYIKLSFHNTKFLMRLREGLKTIINRQTKQMSVGGSKHRYAAAQYNSHQPEDEKDVLEQIVELREYDVLYVQRVCIDEDIRVGQWFDVSVDPASAQIQVKPNHEKIKTVGMYEPTVCAFDIETTKAPLKFPDAEVDRIMMISLMLDDQGYLIVNREICSEDIEDFEYTPKPSYPGPFIIFNEDNEVSVLTRFFELMRENRPHVYVTYNGDAFDWPFIDRRCEEHGMELKKEIGIWLSRGEEYGGRFAIHLDAYAWVQRDSYLPQGSQGLKAVTRVKLGYDPVELDPEDMVPFATERPQELASYSVSDAVATYYLYKKYIESFVFSLCSIIPMPANDTLRKGTGTLCETLLMVEAFKSSIICPNKQVEEPLRFEKDNHLLESDTYVGGHVECLESGVFRDDIPMKFRVNPASLQELLDDLDSVLEYGIRTEGGFELSEITNYDEIKQQIIDKLVALRDKPALTIDPLIYHLDVTSMYPNIILSNRLQPVAIVDEATCAACDFNSNPDKACQRPLEWKWRGKHFPITKGEFNMLKAQIESEKISEDDQREFNVKSFTEFPKREQAERIKERVKTYSRQVYRRITDTREEVREDIVCQRENPFYVDTVRNFRDRRYKYKKLAKKHKGELARAPDELAKKESAKWVTYFDSMQLAHKCILNSFYGYVMRRGSRWYSMPMAAITTNVGANIITEARKLIEGLGRPLELDTDGIWCCLPGSFPEEYDFTTTNKKKPKWNFSYPCAILNHMTYDIFANHQYHNFDDNGTMTVDSECSIFFEVDGPYKCMVLPASPEEGKTLKKRYAVFNKDGTLAELKGFEIKRRGELKIIKIFQEQVFGVFLKGGTLEEVYSNVAKVSNHYLDILDRKGADLDDDELFGLISTNKNMSQTLASYGSNRSTSITCARRLGDFLGAKVIEGSGLNCKFIISAKPAGASVSDRAVPVAIFKAERPVMVHYLRRWLGDGSLNDFDIRSILDWDYYRTRVGVCIQKIVTIPAAMQDVSNPIPRLPHPKWLGRKLRERADPRRQRKISAFFKVVDPEEQNQAEEDGDVEMSGADAGGGAAAADMEDLGTTWMSSSSAPRPTAVHHRRRRKRLIVEDEDDDGDAKMVDDDLKVDDADKENRPSPAANNAAASASAPINPDDDSGAPPPKPGKMEVVDVDAMVDDESGRNVPSSSSTGKTRGDTHSRKRRKASGRIDSYAVRLDSDEAMHGVLATSQSAQLALRASLANIDEKEEYSLEKEAPELKEDFYGWLGVQQSNWSKLRKKRKERKKLRGDEQRERQFAAAAASKSRGKKDKKSKSGGGSQLLPRSRRLPQSFVQSQSRGYDAIYNSTWEVIQIGHDPRNPDRFFMWAFVAREHMLKIPLVVDRKIYINSYEPRARNPEEPQYAERNVQRILPRSRKVGHLSEMTIPEADFITNQAYFNKLLCDQNVEGIYESKVPLHFRCVTELGAFLRVKHSVPRNVLEHLEGHGLEVDNFERTKGESHPYLERTPCNYIYLYNSKKGKRGIFAVVSEDPDADGERTYKATLLVVRPAGLQLDANYAKIVREASEAVGHPSTIDFDVHFFATFDKAVHKLPAALKEHGYGWAAIVFAQSTIPVDHLYRAMPQLLDDSPIVQLASHDSDCQYPALSWYTWALRRMVKRAVRYPEMIIQRRHYARFAQMPIGNLETGDFNTIMADVLFSRELTQHRYALWASPSEFPDCGGVEEDENFFAEERSNPEIIVPGCHRSVCMEFRIANLCVAAIANSKILDELEMDPTLQKEVIARNGADADNKGSGEVNAVGDNPFVAAARGAALKRDIAAGGGGDYGAANAAANVYGSQLRNSAGGGGGGGVHSQAASSQMTDDHRLGGGGGPVDGFQSQNLDLGADSMCRPQFRMLKKLISSWIDDVARPDPTGEKQMHQRIGDHLLEGIYRWIRDPKSKLYDPALCRLVHSMMSTMLIYVVEEIKKLGMKVVYANFSRMIVATGKNDVPTAQRFARTVIASIEKLDLFKWIGFTPLTYWNSLLFYDDCNYSGMMIDETKEGAEPRLDFYWNISSFLPEVAETVFTNAVNTFVTKPYEHVERKKRSGEWSGDMNVSEGDDAPMNDLTSYIISMLKGPYGNDVFAAVAEVDRTLPGDSRAERGARTFPNRPGSHLVLRRPALELAKYLIEVLSLDTAVLDYVSTLKRNLFRLLKVRVFSPEAQFANPCLTYVLPDVTCSYCDLARDLDLCRDKALLSKSEWRCQACKHDYDLLEIEAALVRIAQKRLTAFQVQDLVCSVCRNTKVVNVQKECSCGAGKYRPRLSRAEFHEKMDVFGRIAHFYMQGFLRKAEERDANDPAAPAGGFRRDIEPVHFEWLSETVAYCKALVNGE